MFLCVLTFLLAVAVPLAEGVFTIACASGRDFKVQLHTRKVLTSNCLTQRCDLCFSVWNATQISCVSPELAVSFSCSGTPELLGMWVRVGLVVPVSTPRCWAGAALTQEGWQGAAFENKLCLLEETDVGVMAATCVQLWPRALQTKDNSVLCMFHCQLLFLLNCMYVTLKNLENEEHLRHVEDSKPSLCPCMHCLVLVTLLWCLFSPHESR